jgi:hypothetical protein
MIYKILNNNLYTTDKFGNIYERYQRVLVMVHMMTPKTFS